MNAKLMQLAGLIDQSIDDQRDALARNDLSQYEQHRSEYESLLNSFYAVMGSESNRCKTLCSNIKVQLGLFKHAFQSLNAAHTVHNHDAYNKAEREIQNVMKSIDESITEIERKFYDTI